MSSCDLNISKFIKDIQTSQSWYRIDIDNHMLCKHIQANGFLEAILYVYGIYGNRFHDVAPVLIARLWQHFPVLSALTVLKMGICLNLTNADAKLFGKHLKHARKSLNNIIVQAAMKLFNKYESIRLYATTIDGRMMPLTWLVRKTSPKLSFQADRKDCKDCSTFSWFTLPQTLTQFPLTFNQRLGQSGQLAQLKWVWCNSSNQHSNEWLGPGRSTLSPWWYFFGTWKATKSKARCRILARPNVIAPGICDGGAQDIGSETCCSNLGATVMRRWGKYVQSRHFGRHVPYRWNIRWHFS